MGNCMTSRNCAHDENHKEMLAAARSWGYGVVDLGRVGAGVPDTLISKGFFGVLVEIKKPKGKVSDRQKKWHADWVGIPVVIAHTVDELREVLHEQERIFRKTHCINRGMDLCELLRV